jgi:hypothetical protein
MTTPYASEAKIKAQAEYVCWRDGRRQSQLERGAARSSRGSIAVNRHARRADMRTFRRSDLLTHCVAAPTTSLRWKITRCSRTH